MSDDEKWYREILVKLMGWGAFIFVTMIAWLLSSKGEVFSWSDTPHRSIGLIVLSLMIWPAWFRAVLFVHGYCPTSFPVQKVKAFCAIVIVCVIVVVTLVVLE